VKGIHTAIWEEGGVVIEKRVNKDLLAGSGTEFSFLQGFVVQACSQPPASAITHYDDTINIDP
jgi:hypothetical protein